MSVRLCKKREKARQRALALTLKNKIRPERFCPNCGKSIEKGGHLVPPSMGDPAMWICEREFPGPGVEGIDR